MSTKTLAETTEPKGRKVCSRSASETSGGRWSMNRLAPSGPSCAFSDVEVVVVEVGRGEEEEEVGKR